MSSEARATFLASLTHEEAAALLLDWHFWAREAQRTPPAPWFVWVLMAGRGYGKTRVGAEWAIEQARTPGIRIALVAKNPADARDVLIEGEGGIMACSLPGFMPVYEPTKRRLTWPNRSIARTYSAEMPDDLRGPQHHKAWVDEFAKYKYPQETWDNLMFGLRLGDNPQAVVTTTPRPIASLRAILADSATIVTRGSTDENAANLAPSFLREIHKKYEGTRLGRQELHAELLEDVPGALWTHDLIEQTRVRTHPDLVRLVIAIDPAGSSHEDADETGIVAAGLGADGHGYVLVDVSGRYTPGGWAAKAVSHYETLKADRIVGEVNNGGEMVGHTVRMAAQADGKTVAYAAVHASRGKQTRAEPIAALFEQFRVHHVGMLPELEDQMCSWVPGMKSPDRMDALVWALTDLMIDEPEPVPQRMSATW